MELAHSRPEDRPVLEVFLRDHNSLRVARRAELVNALDHPAVLAWSEGRLVGAATYAIDGDTCEVLTLHAGVRFTGTGSALLAAVKELARDAGCGRLWVVTTNDNVDALRFYQRRGFRLAQLRPGAVDASRQGLKPEIPRLGAHDIPLRDELELELHLTDHDGGEEPADGSRQVRAPSAEASMGPDHSSPSTGSSHSPGANSRP